MGAIIDPKKDAKKSSRRRRRRQVAAPPGDGAPTEDPQVWLERAQAFQARVAESFAHLDVDVSRKDGVLLVDLLNNKGSFQLILVPEKQEIHLLSPVSGPQTYGWDASANAWKHVKDDHDLTGIIVRDHIRAGCVGLPRL